MLLLRPVLLCALRAHTPSADAATPDAGRTAPSRSRFRRRGSERAGAAGDEGTDGDIEAFFAAISGNPCGACGSTDFDGDGDEGTDSDIEAFFRVIAGGPCTL